MAKKFLFKICGDELVTNTHSEPAKYILPLDYKITSLKESELHSWFINSDSKCPIEKYEVFNDQDFILPLVDGQIIFLKTNEIQIQHSAGLITDIYLRVTTKGFVKQSRLISVKVCGLEKVHILQGVSEVNYRQFNARGGSLLINKQPFDSIFTTNDPIDCPLKTKICSNSEIFCSEPNPSVFALDEASKLIRISTSVAANYTWFLRG